MGHTIAILREKHSCLVSTVVIAGLSCLVVLVVLMYAWISEDAFITLRYVNNMLHGFGPVFNVGERVQGYTHPLWFLLLVVSSAVIKNEILVAIVLGVVFTLLFLIILGMNLLKLASDRRLALVVFALVCSAFISSDIWISFQTGGLENSLAHLLLLLIILECYIHRGERPAALVFELSLLCLVRPDYVLFALPFAILILPRLRSFRVLIACLGAMIPALAWFLFAWQYYGSLVPNTGAAKLGVYPNLLYASLRGAIYVVDWFVGDPFATTITLASLWLCKYMIQGRKDLLAVIAGLALYTIWVVLIGGDFMRGRLLMIVFTGATIISSFMTLDYLNKRLFYLPIMRWLALFALTFAVLEGIDNAFEWDPVARAGIVNERRYYPGYSLRYYLEKGYLENPYLDLGFADDLREYAQVCGPIAVHYRNPGTIGYLAGPQVAVIDTLGLTDRYIANLPKEYQVDRTPRPGHVDKFIPVKYLASRGDIALIPNWKELVRQRDCSMKLSVEQLKDSTACLSPKGVTTCPMGQE